MSLQAPTLRIGITDNFRPKPFFDYYVTWLQRIDPFIEVVKLSYLRDNLTEVTNVDGLLLTGGGDVHPQFYGRADAVDDVEEVNEHRDEFELKLIDKALEHDVPILAVCRGMQVFNVSLGGSLLVDISESGYENHRSSPDGVRYHDLHVDPHAMLYFAAGGTRASVNTIHHQAVDRLGRGLKAVGFSPDGVIESLEWVQKDHMPFFLAVQWHPERQQEEKFSRNVASLFLKGVAEFHNERLTASTRAERRS